MLRKEKYAECDHQLSPLGDILSNLPLFGTVGFRVVFLDACPQGLFDGILGCWSSQLLQGLW